MRIAITGTIGSGKSTVCKILEGFGYKVFYTDLINAELLSDFEYLSQIYQYFPNAFEDKKINKEKLSHIIFSSDSNRKILDSIAHPRIEEKLKKIFKFNKDKIIFVYVNKEKITVFSVNKENQK